MPKNLNPSIVVYWECNACDSTQSANETDAYHAVLDDHYCDSAWAPIVPSGWRWFNGKLYCPAHVITETVVTRIDGVTVKEDEVKK